MTSPEPPARGTDAPEPRIKVWYRFVPREGWLPYDQEGVWATQVGPDRVRVDNIPFLVTGAAEGDLVRFTVDDDGLRWVVERVEWSGNCTIRVLPVPTGPLGPSVKAVRQQFAPFGLHAEGFSAELPLVALTVPAGADLAAIKRLLRQGKADGWWEYEEACVGDAWQEA